MDLANGIKKGRELKPGERQRIRKRSNAILVKSVLRVTIAKKSVRGRNKPFANAAGECHIERMRLGNDDRKGELEARCEYADDSESTHRYAHTLKCLNVV